MMGCDPTPDSEERFYVAVFPELTIYGHTTDAHTQSRYPEDWPLTLAGRRQGREWGCWHSVACPAGEVGSQPVGLLAPITYEQFAAAGEKDWPDDYAPTTDAPVQAVGIWHDDGTIEWTWDSLHGDHERETA